MLPNSENTEWTSESNMGATSELKTLFLVINSCLALGGGFFPLSIGVGLVLSQMWEPEVIFGVIGVGTLILGLSSLGHYGAVVEKRGILRVYAALAGLVTMVGVMPVAKLGGIPTVWFTLTLVIFFASITLSATILAMLLAKQTRGYYPVEPSVLAETPSAPAVV